MNPPALETPAFEGKFGRGSSQLLQSLSHFVFLLKLAIQKHVAPAARACDFAA
jgi:hypothetical protein